VQGRGARIVVSSVFCFTSSALVPHEVGRRGLLNRYPSRISSGFPVRTRFYKPRPLLFPWPLEWLLYLVATFYMLLIIFDLSYLSLRTFYLTNPYLNLTTMVQRYDPIKGAEPHWINERYLDTAQATIDRFRADPQDPGLAELLLSLRVQSQTLIDTDPYARVGKTGLLEKLKNRIRERMNTESSTQSFQQFWTRQYLSENSIRFYEEQLEPLLGANYYRDYGEDGEFIDHFWQIDLYFIGFFALELVLRIIYMARVKRITLGEALGERWYDLLWLIPAPGYLVHWPWLRLIRFIPYAVRSDQLGTPFDRVVDYFNRQYTSYLANRVTDLVIVNIISNLEDAIRTLDTQTLLRMTDSQPESRTGRQWEQLFKRQSHAIIHRVLPDIETELVQLLQHTILNALKQAPGHQLVVPLVENNLKQSLHSIYGTLLTNLQAPDRPDPAAQALTEQLVHKLSLKLTAELQAEHTVEDVQDVLIAMLEDVKRSYIAPTVATVVDPRTDLARR